MPGTQADRPRPSHGTRTARTRYYDPKELRALNYTGMTTTGEMSGTQAVDFHTLGHDFFPRGSAQRLWLTAYAVRTRRHERPPRLHAAQQNVASVHSRACLRAPDTHGALKRARENNLAATIRFSRTGRHFSYRTQPLHTLQRGVDRFIKRAKNAGVKAYVEDGEMKRMRAIFLISSACLHVRPRPMGVHRV